MSFFKRNKNEPLIPPVAPAQPAQQDPYAKANGNGGGNQYGGGDPYATRSDPYASRLNDQANPYAKRGGENDAARNELFSGFKAPEKPVAERKYGYEGREQEEDFDEDEEIEGIKQEMRGLKQESLASTRNALRLAREAEESARGTISKLADQSERIANSERYLDMAKANNLRAEDKAAELKQLNKSIFKPVVVWNKEAKRAAMEQKINDRHIMEREDRAKALGDITDTRRRLNGATNQMDRNAPTPVAGAQKAKMEARKRFMIEGEESKSDEEVEDEIDDNLEEVYKVTKTLNKLATGMGEEVAGQNARLTRVTGKTEDLEFAVMKNTERLRRIK